MILYLIFCAVMGGLLSMLGIHVGDWQFWVVMVPLSVLGGFYAISEQ